MTNLSPFSVEILEDELIKDILETLEGIDYQADSREVSVPDAPSHPLQVTDTEENPGSTSGLSFDYSIYFI